MFRLIKSKKGNFVLSYGDYIGTKQIARHCTPEQLIEAKTWILRFYQEPYKSLALADLTPKRLFYPDGAVMNLKEGEKYWVVYTNGKTECGFFNDDSNDKSRLFAGLLYPTEKDAINSYEILKDKYELIRKITEINAENNWVCDWNNRDQAKYYLVYNVKSFRFAASYNIKSQNIYMCKSAIDYLLSSKITDKQRHNFLIP